MKCLDEAFKRLKKYFTCYQRQNCLFNEWCLSIIKNVDLITEYISKTQNLVSTFSEFLIRTMLSS